MIKRNSSSYGIIEIKLYNNSGSLINTFFESKSGGYTKVYPKNSNQAIMMFRRISIGLCSIDVIQSMAIYNTALAKQLIENGYLGNQKNNITFQNNNKNSYKKCLDIGFVELFRLSSSYGPERLSVLASPHGGNIQKRLVKSNIQILTRLLANGENLIPEILSRNDILAIKKSNLNVNVKRKLLPNG